MGYFLALTQFFAMGCGSNGLTVYDEEGLVGARLYIIPDTEVQFPPAAPGDWVTTEVVLLSSGDLPVRIEEIWIEGEQADHFALPETLPIPLELAPAAEFPLNLSYSPDYEGQDRATLMIGTDRLGTVEVSKELIGTGCEGSDCGEDTGWW